MAYIITFLEGMISFISPCILPMLPIYLSYFAGTDIKKLDNKKKVMINAISFVLGFTLIFVLLGVFAGSIGIILKKYKVIVNIVFGIMIVLLGLNFMEIIKFPKRKGKVQKTKIDTKNLSFITSFLLGSIFAITWTPCVGTFLGSALLMASTANHIGEGILMLFSFSMGLGLPFIISSLLIDKLSKTFDTIKKHYRIITKISGGLLILLGILMMTGTLDIIIRILA